MTPIDFLRKPSDSRLRKEIQNICDSYNHPWDLLGELAQNAMDAIRIHKDEHGSNAREHEIKIKINCATRSITVRDTGIGFDPSTVPDLLAPHGSDKDPLNTKTIGQKGVGLTYVVFMADSCVLSSSSISGEFSGEVRSANSWKHGKVGSIPELVIGSQSAAKHQPTDTFTEVCVTSVEEGYTDPTEDLFVQSKSVLEYIIRTKTAIGSTVGAFSDDKETNLKVTLEVIDKDGKKDSIDIEPSYLLPELLIKKDQFVDIDDFAKEAAKLNDKQKIQRLQGKCLRSKGSKTRGGRTIKYYGFYVPSRKTWEDICTKNDLMKQDDDSDAPLPLYYGGIYLCTRKMPTGIELSHPVTGSAGYWANNFILIEDNSLTFDLGRKSVPTRTQGLLKEIAKELFLEFRSWWGYLSTDPDVTGKLANVANFEKFQTFDELKALPELGVPNFSFLKHPDQQEAAVAALFHQLVGAGMLKGYGTLRTGFKESYDLWGLYETRKEWIGAKYHPKLKEGAQVPVIIEFKYSAEAILLDFENNKLFSDIDLIVCWDLDQLKFAKSNVAVRVLPDDEKFYNGSTYELEWAGAYGLGDSGIKRVLALRPVIEALAKK